VNRIATAVTNFKADYGVDPPSSIVLCENQAGWNANSRSRGLIREIWPQFDFTMNRDLNQDGDTTDTFALESGETLVFFLGGLPVRDNSTNPPTFSLLGFTKNPQNPFSLASNANRAKSAYDFESGRLVDLDDLNGDGTPDGDGFPEFLDSYPGQRNPIIYFSSYGGTSYRLADYPGNAPAFQATPGPVDKTLPINWYMQGTNAASPPFNAKSFQIISPGMDGNYGPGGPYVANAATPLPAWSRTSTPAAPTDVSVTAAEREAERDNITNFGNGKLVP
jgi:hypothetical protein